MTKQEFLKKLRAMLSGLPEEDIEERLTFYGEMIDDRMEEGLTEKEAVEEIGSVDEIASQITADASPAKNETQKTKRQQKKWMTVLLAVGSIVWVPILCALISVIVALYCALWAVIISLWAAFCGICAGAIGGIAAGITLMIVGKILQGIAMVGAALVCVGLAIFSFLGCRVLTKGALFITKKIMQGIRNFFTGKEEA